MKNLLIIVLVALVAFMAGAGALVPAIDAGAALVKPITAPYKAQPTPAAPMPTGAPKAAPAAESGSQAAMPAPTAVTMPTSQPAAPANLPLPPEQGGAVAGDDMAGLMALNRFCDSQPFATYIEYDAAGYAACVNAETDQRVVGFLEDATNETMGTAVDWAMNMIATAQAAAAVAGQGD